MARVFISGSADGLGFLAGERLANEGHDVVLHARSEARAAQVKKRLPKASAVLVGDVATLAAMTSVAEQANALGRFDAVIHNVATGYNTPSPAETTDGIAPMFAVNTLAPYVLTARMTRPDRLVYLSSGLHQSATPTTDDLEWKTSRASAFQAYSDTKLHDLWLAFAIARRWPDVRSNALEPGWVPTKMGGAGAPDDLVKGAITQAWLAVSDDAAAKVTGRYFFHQKEHDVARAARDEKLQDALLAYCEKLSGVKISA